MALKCVTCGLLFRNRNELDWHIQQEHLQQRLPPAKDQPASPAATPRTQGERQEVSNDYPVQAPPSTGVTSQ
jgi:hypothetical protein